MFFTYLTFFFIYAFFGWGLEVIHAALKTGKFVNRGFLNGCVCPVYGVGVILVLLCLTPINQNLFLLFGAGLALTSVLEFFTGFVLEKIFHTKWWDYSQEHFNIKGYVCLKYSLLWGMACVIVVDLVHPLIVRLIEKMPGMVLYVFCGICTATFIVDLFFTLLQLIAHNKNYAAFDKICDNLKFASNAIGGKISAATLDLEKKLQAAKEKIKSSRLYKAFPEQRRKSKRIQGIELSEYLSEKRDITEANTENNRD